MMPLRKGVSSRRFGFGALLVGGWGVLRFGAMVVVVKKEERVWCGERVGFTPDGVLDFRSAAALHCTSAKLTSVQPSECLAWCQVGAVDACARQAHDSTRFEFKGFVLT